MERILERSLKKLRKACSSRSDKDLIQAIEACRSKLSDGEFAKRPRANSVGVADPCFEPFRIAAGKRSVKMKVAALDALEKLIAHGFLRGGDVLIPADPIVRQPEITLMDRIIETICECRNGTSSSEVHLQIIKALLTAVSSSTSKVHNRSLLATVRCCYDIYLNSRNDIIVTTTKACLTQILHAVFQQMEISAPDDEDENLKGKEEEENEESKPKSPDTKGKQPPPIPPPPVVGIRGQSRMKFPSLAHEDAYLLFQALCDMAMKSYLTDDAGDEFRRTESILQLLKDDLCRALLQNCLASQTDVVDISLKIFMKLITAFKDYLVAQIEVFINTIFLRLLDSPNTTFEHKLGVLQVFYKICQDENAVVEIFLNYDAHYTGQTAIGDGSLMEGLFESIVLALEKVAQGKGQSDQKKSRTSAQDLQLRKVALASLVAILDSLVKFTHDDEDNSTRNAGLYVEQTPFEKRKYDDDEDNTTTETKEKETKFSTPSSSSSSTSSLLTSTPSSASQLGTVLDEKRRLQKELNIAFELFKQKPKKGLQYLVEKGLLKLEPAPVAKFLSQYSEQLDKTQIGDYLGGEKEFNLQVLHSYIDRIDLGGMEYDEAIRSFLTGFRLPGEAQKIDRIMEKFAARYCECNPERFANADTAFILGYAIIMLQTDLHNPNIKPEKKMTKDTFARQNRGIDDGKDLPRDFLDGIYTRIKENPFTLREDDLAREQKERNEGKVSRGLFFDENRHRAKKFAKESQKMAQQSMAVLRGAIGDDERRYCKITNNRDHIRPMFEIAWEPMLAVFSVLMERTSSENMFVVDLCLRGIRHALRIAGIEGMDEPLMSFMHCLAKYTGLSRPFYPKGSKEIACIKALLATALSEGNHLRTAWNPLLACISQLSRLQLYARGGIDSIVPGSTPARPVKPRGGFASIFNSAEQQQREQDEARRIVSEYVTDEVDMRSLDRIFVQSNRLDSNAIASFVEALCGISTRELEDSRHLSGFAPDDSKATSSRRVFSLQKVVEVADFNIGCRGRMTWLKMWRELADYFKHVGSHPVKSIAMYAIDSLKQLSMKFLEKGEMKGFNFQSSFLKPFEHIIASSPNVSIRELVLCVMQNIVLARGANIRSGWRSVFRVLRAAARDNSVACVTLGFSVVEHIVRNTFGLASRMHYTDLVSCVLAYTESSEVESVALKAIDLLMICCDHLASGRVSAVVDDGRVMSRSLSSRTDDGDETESKIGLDNQGRVRRAGRREEEDEDEEEDENNLDMNQADGKGKENEDVTTPKTPTENFQFQNSERHRILWWPSLTGLSELITCPYLEVRFHAMRSLFQLLRRCSKQERFSKQMWIRIFRFVLFRIFTSVHVFSQQVSAQHQSSNNNNSLASLRQMSQEDRDSCRLALNEVIKLFSERLEDTIEILEELLLLLRSFVAQTSLDLACIGVDCMKLLLLVTGEKFDQDTWTRVCKELEYLFTKCMPNELIQVLRVFQTKECQDAMMKPNTTTSRSGHHLHSTNQSSSRLRRSSSGTRGPPPAPPSRSNAASVNVLKKGAKVTTNFGGGVIQQIREDGIAVVTLSASNTTLYASSGVVLASHAAEEATKNEVVNMLSRGRLPFDELLVFTRCKVQLELLPALTSIVEAHFERLNFTNLMILLNCLRASLDVARDFNRAKRYRVSLSEMGFMKHLKLSKLTNLLRQETAAIQLSRTILFRMASMTYEMERCGGVDESVVKHSTEIESRLRRHCEELVSRYLECDDSTRVFLENQGQSEAPAPGVMKRIEEGRMMIAFDVHVVQLIQALRTLPVELFERYIPWSFTLLIKLIRCQNLDLRQVVMDVMKSRVKMLVLKGCAGSTM